MNRAAVACILLVGGCAWNNSLYQARSLTKDAARAEREKRPFDAPPRPGVKWLARPSRRMPGRHGAGAVRKRSGSGGHAAARINDCARSRARARSNPRCSRDPIPNGVRNCSSSSTCATRQRATPPRPRSTECSSLRPPTLPSGARRASGKVTCSSCKATGPKGWRSSRGEDTLPARLDRAMALAQLGRTDRALADLAPLLAARRLERPMAELRRRVRNARNRRHRCAAHPTAGVSRRPRRAAFVVAAHRCSGRTRTRSAGSGPPAGAAQYAAIRCFRARRANAPRGTRIHARDIGTAGARCWWIHCGARASCPEGGAAMRIAALQRNAERLIARDDSTAAGTPNGDLVMFALAEFARDSLRAPNARRLVLRADRARLAAFALRPEGLDGACGTRARLDRRAARARGSSGPTRTWPRRAAISAPRHASSGWKIRSASSSLRSGEMRLPRPVSFRTASDAGAQRCRHQLPQSDSAGLWHRRVWTRTIRRHGAPNASVAW